MLDLSLAIKKALLVYKSHQTYVWDVTWHWPSIFGMKRNFSLSWIVCIHGLKSVGTPIVVILGPNSPILSPWIKQLQ